MGSRTQLRSAGMRDRPNRAREPWTGPDRAEPYDPADSGHACVAYEADRGALTDRLDVPSALNERGIPATVPRMVLDFGLVFLHGRHVSSSCWH